MAPPRVLITGSTGLLGREIAAEFSRSRGDGPFREAWDVTRLGFSRAGDHALRINLRDPAAVAKVIHDVVRSPGKGRGDDTTVMSVFASCAKRLRRRCRGDLRFSAPIPRSPLLPRGPTWSSILLPSAARTCVRPARWRQRP